MPVPELDFLKKVGKGAGVLFIGIIISKFLTYLFRAIVARSFGASEYGLLILAVSVVSFIASAIVIGLPQGLLRYVAFYIGKSQNNLISPMVGSVVKITLPLSILFSLVLWKSANYISILFFHKPELIPLIRFFAFLVPFLVLYNILDNVLQAFQDAKALVISRNLVDPFAKLSFLALFLVVGFGFFGAAVAYFAGIVFSVFAMIYFLRRKIPGFFDIFKFQGKLSKELVSYSWPLLFTNFSLLIFSWADVIMLGYFLPSAEVGIYDAASATSRLLSVVPLAFSTMFMPAITEVFAKNRSSIGKFYIHISKWVLLLLLPVLFFIAMFSKTILGTFFSYQFEGGAASLIILSIGQLVWGWGLLSSNILAMLKHTKIIFLTSAFAAFLNLVLNILLIPGMGIEGAAIATAISLFVSALLNILISSRFIKAWPFNLSFFKLIASITLPVIALMLLFHSFVIELPLIYAMGVGIIFALVYVMMLFVTKSFDSDDMEIFRLGLKKLNLIKR